MNEPVEYPLAKLLKEKGFDVPVRNYYLDSDISKQIHEGFEDSYWGDNRIVNWNKDVIGIKPFYGFNSAPTIAEVVMWLYEKHEIWVMVEMTGSKRFYPRGRMVDKEGKHFVGDFKDEKGERLIYNSPTEAYEAAIEYTLNKLI